MSDTRIITSQYVEIEQTPASVGERIFAQIIDIMIMTGYCWGMIHFIIEIHGTSILTRDGDILLYFILFLPVIFYSFLWEVFNNGRSPGKILFKTRVVMRDGSVPSAGAYFLRWMLFLIDFWIGAGGTGILVMLLNSSHRRTGDLAAGTMVIKERKYRSIQVSLDEYNHLSRNYRPHFVQAENLSLEQANTISEALSRHDRNRQMRISLLSSKVREFLNIHPDMEDAVFLATLLRDYQYFALEEI